MSGEFDYEGAEAPAEANEPAEGSADAELVDEVDFDYRSNPDTSAVDVLEAKAFLDEFLEQEGQAEFEAASLSREQYDESLDFLNRRINELHQELGLVEPVDSRGHTEAQHNARIQLEIDSWLDQGDPDLRGARRVRADEIANELAGKYGPGPEVAHAAMQLADQEVVPAAAAFAEFDSMLAKAAKMRGLEDFDAEKAMSRGFEVYPEIVRDHPGIGEVAFGLAALAAIDEQDGRDIERPLSDFWGSAAALVQHLKDPGPAPTDHDYTKGGTVTRRFFGNRSASRGTSV